MNTVFIFLLLLMAISKKGLAVEHHQYSFQYGGHDYLLVGQHRKLNWHNARRFCRLRGMDLAIIGDEAEHLKIRSHIDNYFPEMRFHTKQWWIGLSDEAKEGDWRDVCYRKATFTKWVSGQPNVGNNIENCVHMSNSNGWSDFVCDVEMAFVCESDPGCGLNSVSVSFDPTNRFLLVNKMLTWFEARGYCSNLDLDLAIFNHAAEHSKAVDQVMRFFYIPQQYWWVGLNDIDQEQKFVDICGESPNYKDFPVTWAGSIQPSDDCVGLTDDLLVRLRDHKYQQFPCCLRQPFICGKRREGCGRQINRFSHQAAACAPPTTTATTKTTTTTTTTTSTATAPPTTTTTELPTTTTTPKLTTTLRPSTSKSTTPEVTTKAYFDTTTATSNTGCRDEYPDCAGLGPRVCTGLSTWAADHCRSYCNHCQAKNPCHDTTACERFGDTICSAAPLSLWVDTHCRKFCNRC